MLEKVGVILVAIGGMFLFLALYLIAFTALYQHFNPTGGIFGALFFGFAGFFVTCLRFLPHYPFSKKVVVSGVTKEGK